ncbi:MAG: threonylcarbamoyl-AMP synthase, partial [Sedimentisphaerales bacterium]|nr:threonylcarbamoyl-AMP synthase [Sedimentisphaerales bacterium]
MKTKVVEVDSDNVDSSQIKEAAEVVDGGGLVAFPTETVYGIACRVTADSLARLDGIKNRDASKAYTLHISRREEVGKYVPTMRLRVGKLIAKAWPGPLTVVFELSAEDIEKQQGRLGREVFEGLYRGGSVGVRCPDNPVASALLEHTRHAVVAPSANPGGASPAVDAQEVLDMLDGKIDLVLDGGLCKYGKSSTVVKIGREGIEILRGGVYASSEIEEYSQVKVLFVCTGNTCRSPMAEGIFRKYLAEKLHCEVDQLGGLGYKVSSAGLLNLNGASASSESVAA